MRTPTLTLSLLAFLAPCVLAQTQPAKQAPKVVPSLSIEPAAQAVLDRAIQSYNGASGIRYGIAKSYLSAKTRKGPKDMGTNVVRYSSPDKLSISRRGKTGLLSDGSNLYWIIGTDYYKQTLYPESLLTLMGSEDTSSQIIAAMMKGNNPAAVLHDSYSGGGFKNFKISPVTALAPRIVDGDVLSGVQYTYSCSLAMEDDPNYSFSEQVTAWFGGSPLMLRRVQTTNTAKGKTLTYSEKIIDQQLNPPFAEDTFKFNDTGLKLTTDEEQANKTYWDPRLKVGATPFPFQARALDGTPISLDKYKGKVLVLDFWATWCGPCVASLPELKGAYDKYHSQGLEVVSVSLDEDKSALTSFVKAKKMAWPQVFDGKAWKSALPTSYGVQAIPFLLVVGKNGKIAAVNPRGKIDEAVKAALAAR